jgi:1,4-alpha-glucan branching enzyme
MMVDGVYGVHFAVWAPNAQRVSVVGGFNAWDGRRHQMRKRIDSGVWEIFAPDIGEGTVYKYEIVGKSGRLLPLKADPLAFVGEVAKERGDTRGGDGEDFFDRSAVPRPRWDGRHVSGYALAPIQSRSPSLSSSCPLFSTAQEKPGWPEHARR